MFSLEILDFLRILDFLKYFFLLYSYAINTLHLSASEVSKITGTSPETINKHYAGADIEEIAKKMRG